MQPDNAFERTRRAARVAGLLYLLVAITGAFSIMYIPSTFVVPGNATATAGRIAASLVFKSGFLPRFLGVLHGR